MTATPSRLPLLYLGAAEVEQLLPMGECIALMEGALRELALGAAVQPLRSVMRLEGVPGLLGVMPGQIAVSRTPAAAPGAGGPGGAGGLGGPGDPAGPGEPGEPGGPGGHRLPSVAGVKVVSIFPGNRERGDESHFGAVLLFETATGRPIAYLDAAAITAIRTAAVSAVATRLLARAEAGDLALLGAGVQAHTHLAALSLVRELRRVRVWSRRPESARGFAAAASARHGMAVEASPSAAAAVAGADLVCTVTAAREPVLAGEWLAPGTHVNAVGASAAASRELDSAAVARARLFVDRRESTINESGDFLFPLREGAIAEDHIQGEIGELLLGRLAGRRAASEITLFKSLGLAVEDLAAAHHVYRQALARGRGLRLDAAPAPAAPPASAGPAPPRDSVR
ncbi:MAG: ornithine cyclodeaminase family protein [Acidobacteria bacterium]|nr:ornithine cyclodeaminase family protein [Acidobacteriota bacterium]